MANKKSGYGKHLDWIDTYHKATPWGKGTTKAKLQTRELKQSVKGMLKDRKAKGKPIPKSGERMLKKKK